MKDLIIQYFTFLIIKCMLETRIRRCEVWCWWSCSKPNSEWLHLQVRVFKRKIIWKWDDKQTCYFVMNVFFLSLQVYRSATGNICSLCCHSHRDAKRNKKLNFFLKIQTSFETVANKQQIPVFTVLIISSAHQTAAASDIRSTLRLRFEIRCHTWRHLPVLNTSWVVEPPCVHNER